MLYHFAGCTLDPAKRELRRDGETVALEPKVFDLLHYMAANPETVLTKDAINRDVWDGRIVSDSALSSAVRAARAAIGDDGRNQSAIRTVHGRGFSFIAPVEQADEMRRDTREHPTIAVVPFENLSGNDAEDYFADGMTADMIGNLTRHRWLKVVPRNTMVQFKGAETAAIVAGTGADYLTEGTVRKAGDRVRVTVELVDASTQSCIWSESYDRQSADFLDLQDDIAQTIAARLEPAIGSEVRRKVARNAGARNLRAWETYHLGISHFFKFTRADNEEAQRLLDTARRLDPEFGDAHAWWAYAVVLGTVYWDGEASQARLDEALAATQRALEIDDANAVYYALRARLQLARREYQSAIEGNRRALELNPTFAAAHCGLADSLTYLGRYDEAVEEFERAIELSTNDPQRWAFFTYGALALIFRGDYERAVEWADRAGELPNHQYWTYAHKAVALAHLGQLDEAQRAYRKAADMHGAFSPDDAVERLYFLQDREQLDQYRAGLEKAQNKDIR